MGRLRGIYPEESKAAFKGVLAHRVFARHLSGGLISNEDFDRVCKEEIGAALFCAARVCAQYSAR